MRAPLNFLPWRDAARRKRRRHALISTLVGITVAVLLVAAPLPRLLLEQQEHRARLDALREQHTHNVRRLTEHATLEQEHAVARNTLQTLDHFEQRRRSAERLLATLTTITPDSITLDRLNLQRQSGQLRLQGVGHSHADLSAFADKLERIAGFHHPHLDVVEQVSTEDASEYRFILFLDQVMAP